MNRRIVVEPLPAYSITGQCTILPVGSVLLECLVLANGKRVQFSVESMPEVAYWEADIGLLSSCSLRVD